MLDWFFSLFKKPTPKIQSPEESADCFMPKSRLVYKYFTGQGILTVDPLWMYKRIVARSEDLSKQINIKESEKSTPKETQEASTRVVQILREIFNVEPLSENGTRGLSEAETEALLDHFLEFTEGIIKKNPPGGGATTIPINPKPTPDPSPPVATAVEPPKIAPGAANPNREGNHPPSPPNAEKPQEKKDG